MWVHSILYTICLLLVVSTLTALIHIYYARYSHNNTIRHAATASCCCSGAHRARNSVCSAVDICDFNLIRCAMCVYMSVCLVRFVLFARSDCTIRAYIWLWISSQINVPTRELWSVYICLSLFRHFVRAVYHMFAVNRLKWILFQEGNLIWRIWLLSELKFWSAVGVFGDLPVPWRCQNPIRAFGAPNAQHSVLAGW